MFYALFINGVWEHSHTSFINCKDCLFFFFFFFFDNPSRLRRLLVSYVHLGFKRCPCWSFRTKTFFEINGVLFLFLVDIIEVY